MKNIFTVSLVSFFLIFTLSSSAQLQRNPVLEYVTGTWCQYCPCGHSTIRNSILPNFPNTITIGYHGPSNSSDPFRVFNGNEIITLLPSAGYPTATVDRSSVLTDYTTWYNKVNARYSVPATVQINILKIFNEANGNLDMTIKATALTDLTGNFNVTVVLMEDELAYPQTGNSGCIGGSDYKHDHVVRSILNGARGDQINQDGQWAANQMLEKSYSFTVPSGINYNNCTLVVFVYKLVNPNVLNSSQIQQGNKWPLKGDIVPVELSGFTASVEGRSILLSWETVSEKNNLGFTVERSVDGETFIPAGFVKGNGTTTEQQFYSFKDKPEENGIYYYRLKQQDYNGTFTNSEVLSVKMDMPSEFSLAQNYPNPFNPSTVISFSLPAESFVSLKVFDVTGREVQELVSGIRNPGTHDIIFDAKDLSAGIYFYKLTAGSFTDSKKLVVLK